MNLFLFLTGNDSDQDFDPSVEMMVDDFDDERTLEEEEAIAEEDSKEEIDELTKVSGRLIDFNWCSSQMQSKQSNSYWFGNEKIYYVCFLVLEVVFVYIETYIF